MRSHHQTAIDPALRTLVDEAWREHLWNTYQPFLAMSSIPILYFGDLERYLVSPIRVVTVGLNPSRVEFPENDRFQRFPQARALDAGKKDEMFYRQYIAALSDYFRANPYTSWFDAYEYLLHGLDASYYDGARNTALHTDLCSPLATDPTWSKLSLGQRRRLEASGMPLWHRLVRYLAPDVLLISIARQYRDMIAFPNSGDWETIHTVMRDNPYIVQGRRLHITDDKATLCIFGIAAQTPFGTVARADKCAIGAQVKGILRV